LTVFSKTVNSVAYFPSVMFVISFASVASRTVKRGHVFQPPENPAAEIRFIQEEFGMTA